MWPKKAAELRAKMASEEVKATEVVKASADHNSDSDDDIVYGGPVSAIS